MAAVKSQEEQFSWLDNSFMSVATTSVDASHSAKRNNCSAVSNGRRKSAKLHCVTQKDCDNSISVGRRQQGFNVKCNSKISVDARKHISPSDADENKNTKVTEQSWCQNDTDVSSAVDVNDEVHLFSEQDQSPISLVFAPVFFF